ncbi:phospholipase effector Tle1 domain-containing protein [Flavobacterium sp.]|uniref:phospholipase effector Tle1 domain-containing protein n=1 Tax=Flavobacterium sp. TaxID=239 RepID=UPI002B4B881A|nr:DUF2235 domain-containing protein [Flavobacterium sp.]HLP65512.1 DUF2235 domain-containing protein [Flavobacterium sp.]
MQNINSPQKTHKVKRLGLGNKENTEETDYLIGKTKIDFVIGVFFDGTGNNRFNSDLVYYKHLDKNNNVIEQEYKPTKVKSKKKDFIAETDSSYWNPYSNVALLHDLYKIGLEKTKDKNTYYIRQYVQGIGTLEEEDDDILGSGFGIYKRGVIGKVQEACIEISRQISDILKNKNYAIGSLTFDVYGFSRGAAAARHFCNEIIGVNSITTNFKSNEPNSKNKIVKIVNTRVSSNDKFMPKSQSYTLGMLGDEFKNKKIYYKFTDDFSTVEDNNKVSIRFLGLFDTVVSQFISKYYGDFNLDKLKEYNELIKVKSLQEANIDISKLNIKRVLHLTARDEWRENFPLTKTNYGITIPMLGAHSDIGGGYAALQKEYTKIHLFKVVTGTNEEETYYPKIGKKEKEMKNFFIKDGFCNKENEIEFKKIGEITKKIKINNIDTSVVNGVVMRLEANRIIKPRYSTVSLTVMKQISQKAGVPLVNDLNEIKNKESKTKPQPFEYIVPKDLEDYLRIVLEVATEKYELLYNKKIVKAKSKLTTEIINKIRHEYIHLSSNFNKPEFQLPVVVKKYNYEVTYNLNEVEFINKMAYINHPRLSNKTMTPYEREILSP